MPSPHSRLWSASSSQSPSPVTASSRHSTSNRSERSHTQARLTSAPRPHAGGLRIGGIRTVPIPDVTIKRPAHVGKSAAEATAKLVPLQRKAEAEEAARKAKKARKKAKRAKKAQAEGKKKARRK